MSHDAALINDFQYQIPSIHYTETLKLSFSLLKSLRYTKILIMILNIKVHVNTPVIMGVKGVIPRHCIIFISNMPTYLKHPFYKLKLHFSEKFLL